MSKQKFELLQERHPDVLVLEMQGNFYKAFNDSAFVLSGLMEYKLKETKTGYKCGFPVVAYEKVNAACESHRINYVVYEGEKVVDQNSFEDNQFCNYCKMYEPDPENVCSLEQVPEKKQALLIVDGCGMNASDAIVDLKNNVEREILGKGFRVISLSVFSREVNKVVIMQGLAVYE